MHLIYCSLVEIVGVLGMGHFIFRLHGQHILTMIRLSLIPRLVEMEMLARILRGSVRLL